MSKLVVSLDLSGVSSSVSEKLKVLESIGLLDSYVLNTLVKEVHKSDGFGRDTGVDCTGACSDTVSPGVVIDESSGEGAHVGLVDTTKEDTVVTGEGDKEVLASSHSAVGGKILIKGRVDGVKPLEKSEERSESGSEVEYDERALEFINNMMSM